MGRLIGTTTSYSFLTGRSFTNAYTYDAASNRIGTGGPGFVVELWVPLDKNEGVVKAQNS
jgi:hypothetical protein